jgi:membrane-associated phospholipid phosphatase
VPRVTSVTGARATGADQPTFRQGTPLGHVVPEDLWRPVRITLMVAYGLAYAWWLRVKGLPLDRISVTISVVLFLGCAFIGRPRHVWRLLAIDCLLYAAMWYAYERTRGAADALGFPLQVEAMRDVDRFLFLGNDPNVVLQEHFWHDTVRWWDVVASLTYHTHFVLPVVAIAILWVASHRQWVRFMKRFATLLLVACAMFVVLPTAPPWMVSQKYELMAALHRDPGRGVVHIGFKGFVHSYNVALGNGNPVAAMPSLHASFALIVPAFFLPWIKPRWLKVLVLAFPLVMLTSLVYLGEHWAIDGLVGWAIVGAAFWFWNRMERRGRRQKAARARVALAGLV